MTRHGIDQDALIFHISQAMARQGDALRKAVSCGGPEALPGSRAAPVRHRAGAERGGQGGGIARTAGSPPGQADVEASSPAAPKPVFGGVCIAVPAIASCTVFSYRVFSGMSRALRYP